MADFPETQWAVRCDHDGGGWHILADGSEQAVRERAAADGHPGTARTVIRRTVTYGEWEDADA